SLADTLSTLVHEMVHVWQHYAPVKKCRGGYHDRVWGAKMEEVGLMPSKTGLPGGKKNWQQMTHYIIRGGRFQKAVYDLLKNGFSISWYDRWSDGAIVTSKINSDILDDWLAVTDENDTDLINRLSLTVSKSRPELIPDDDDLSVMIKPPVKGTGTRMKFTCPECGLNAWAKPSAVLLCGECRCELMAAE
ncbi:sprT domain-containing protein, partial [Salmonella enterica]|nr:sprT domain-containing protein [Salmonella enterica]